MRDIRSHLAQIYGIEVSPDLISKVTDAVVEELVTWQNRPLDAVWPISLGQRRVHDGALVGLGDQAADEDA